MKHRFIRLCALACLAAGTGGASRAATGGPVTTAGAPPAQHAPLHRHKRHAAIKPALPATAAAPAAQVASTSPAPVPNEAVAAPIDNAGPDTQVAPSVFRLHYPPQGDGYTTGSSSQAMDDREAATATGVEVKVPLPQ